MTSAASTLGDLPDNIERLAYQLMEQGGYEEAYGLFKMIGFTSPLHQSVQEGQMAKCAEILENDRLAHRHYAKSYKLWPEASSFFHYARFLFNKGDTDGALELAQDVLRTELSNRDFQARAFLILGHCQMVKEENHLALTSFDRAVELGHYDPMDDYCVTIARGQILFSEGKYEQAIATFAQIEDSKAPAYFWATYYTADAYMRMKNYAQSESYYAEALMLEPEHMGSFQGYITSLSEQNKWNEAFDVVSVKIDTVIPSDPDYSEFMRLQAMCLRELGDIETATHILSEASELDPDNYRILSTSAVIDYQMGNIEAGEISAKQSFMAALAAGDKHWARETIAHLFVAAVEGGHLETAKDSWDILKSLDEASGEYIEVSEAAGMLTPAERAQLLADAREFRLEF